MKTNQRFLRRRWRIKQRLQALQHLTQHDIVLQEFLVDFGKASERREVGNQLLPQSHKGADQIQAHLHRLLAALNIRGHQSAVFREHPRQILSMPSSTVIF